MKTTIAYIFFLCTLLIAVGCKKEGNYPGGTISPYIAMFDLRNLHTEKEVALTKENMYGATKITGVVISDHTGGNIPAGLLILQDRRRLSQLRGIAVAIGEKARDYTSGDSVIINVEGGTLKRIDGILQLTGISEKAITKVSSGNVVIPTLVKSANILSSPEAYESTLVTINKAGFDPSLPVGSTYTGEKLINDGFGALVLYTDVNAAYANNSLPFLTNFTGIVLKNLDGTPQLRVRNETDILILSATAPKIAPLVITGYLVDPSGTDANYEYIQFMATKDIDFAVTPFSIVTTNNAGASTPTGYPLNGWATGGLRTYKINLITGSVKKGAYFYVGGIKKIWGSASADVTSSNWFSKMYATEDGDGFGTKTANLLANSGNAAGIAVFDKIEITESAVPVDVIFFGGNGQLYTPTPSPKGCRITNSDYYDINNPSTQEEQPYFAMGSNTGKLAFPTTSNFAQLGGTYNKSTGRWTKARALQNIVMSNSSTLADIEGATAIEE